VGFVTVNAGVDELASCSTSMLGAYTLVGRAPESKVHVVAEVHVATTECSASKWMTVEPGTVRKPFPVIVTDVETPGRIAAGENRCTAGITFVVAA